MCQTVELLWIKFKYIQASELSCALMKLAPTQSRHLPFDSSMISKQNTTVSVQWMYSCFQTCMSGKNGYIFWNLLSTIITPAIWLESVGKAYIPQSNKQVEEEQSFRIDSWIQVLWKSISIFPLFVSTIVPHTPLLQRPFSFASAIRAYILII